MDDDLRKLNSRMPVQAGLRLLVAAAMIVGTGLVLQATRAQRGVPTAFATPVVSCTSWSLGSNGHLDG
jgi:hypothetical protein